MLITHKKHFLLLFKKAYAFAEMRSSTVALPGRTESAKEQNEKTSRRGDVDFGEAVLAVISFWHH